MPDEGEAVIFEFDFEGKTNATSERPAISEISEAEKDAVNNLNEKKDELSTELQREVERVLQPFAFGSVTTKVELEFKTGESVIVLGTLAAGFVSSVVSGALAPNLAKLIESGFRRIFRSWQRPPWELFTPPQGGNFDPFTVNVSPRQTHQQTSQKESELTPEPSHRGESEIIPEPSHQRTGLAPTGQLSTPWLQVQQQTNSQPPVKETSGTLETGGAVEARDIYWLLLAIAIGIALNIVLLAVILTIVIMRLG